MILRLPSEDDFIDEYDKITSCANYEELTKHVQHARVSVARHALAVAVLAYRIAKFIRLRLDYRALVRGSLLHDYFFYDWHDKNKGFRLHGSRHAGIALYNADRDFDLSPVERNMIASHMFPLSLTALPKYKESWMLTLSDKIVTLMEVFRITD